jgi:hypothetical protein
MSGRRSGPRSSLHGIGDAGRWPDQWWPVHSSIAPSRRGDGYRPGASPEPVGAESTWPSGRSTQLAVQSHCTQPLVTGPSGAEANQNRPNLNVAVV